MYSKFKKSIRLIHLWLGLASGLIIFIIAITGAIWAFESEISDVVYPYRKLEIQNNKPTISIAEIKEKVKPYLKNINAIYYLGKDRSIQVRAWQTVNGKLINNYVYLNPYTGEVLKVKINNPSFFDVVVELHTSLLLGEIGTEIVRYATMIFFLLLASGIYLWWPKKKLNLKQRLKFDWKETTKWRRKNFDLHSILGFYASWIIIFSTITGLAWGFKWVDKTIYAIATLGKSYQDYAEVNSISHTSYRSVNAIDDSILNFGLANYNKPVESWNYYFPQNDTASISLYLNPDSDTYYKASNYFFDQRTGKLLLTESAESYNNGQTIRNMYYDIHIGKILGFPGQLLVFFGSLIVASLPITGFYIWYGRYRKTKKLAKLL
jgi:uncharacterized iron-regulated membrane protein